MTMALTKSYDELVTGDQIAEAKKIVEEALLTSGIFSEAMETLLRDTGLRNKLLVEVVGVFRRSADAVSDRIIRRVAVYLDCTNEAALRATRRTLHVNPEVVASMPRGFGSHGRTIIFFKVGHFLTDDALEKEYAIRDLVPADMLSLCALNQDDPSFADTYPHVTHWKDAEGNWCSARFDRRLQDRRVHVDRHDGQYSDYAWYAGMRDVTPGNSYSHVESEV